jgi:hypothetical protein
MRDEARICPHPEAMTKGKMLAPRLIIEWPAGLDAEPVVYPVAETDEQAAQLLKFFEQRLAKPRDETPGGSEVRP